MSNTSLRRFDTLAPWSDNQPVRICVGGGRLSAYPETAQEGRPRICDHRARDWRAQARPGVRDGIAVARGRRRIAGFPDKLLEPIRKIDIMLYLGPHHGA